MDVNKLYVTDESGKEIEMEIMFTFSENGKNYVVYFNPEDDDENTDLFVSCYDEEGNLYPVETEEEWDMIDEIVGAFIEDSEETEQE